MSVNRQSAPYAEEYGRGQGASGHEKNRRAMRPMSGRRRRRSARRERSTAPRMVMAYFKQWGRRELDLQRAAASASELVTIVAEQKFMVRDRETYRARVLTLMVDGLKLSNRAELIATVTNQRRWRKPGAPSPPGSG